MTRITLFGKRTLSLFLALLLLLSALPAALAEAPGADGYALAFEDVRVPASSKDVDDSTESGKMLKEYLEWLETAGDPEMGSNTPVETWEADPDTEDEWRDATNRLDMISIDLPMELVSEDALNGLGLGLDTLGVENLDELDKDGDGLVESLYGINIIKDATREGLRGLMNGDPQKAMIDWGKKTILAYVFGDLTKPDPFAKLADIIERGFREINAKLDAIKKQIEEVLKLLKKVLNQLTVNAYRQDISDAANIRDDLNSIRNVTRMSLDKAGTNAKQRQGALEIFHKWNVNNSVYLATAKLGDRLVRTQTNSGKNIFFIAYTLADLTHYEWDHQQAIEENTMRNYFLLVYMEQMAYCKLSLLWQIQKNKKNPVELNNLCSLYKLLFTGDQKNGVVSNVSMVMKGLEEAPAYKEDMEQAILRERGGNLKWYFRRSPDLSSQMDYEGPSRAEILQAYRQGGELSGHQAGFDTWKHFLDIRVFHRPQSRYMYGDFTTYRFLKSVSEVYSDMGISEALRAYAGLFTLPGSYVCMDKSLTMTKENDILNVGCYMTLIKEKSRNWHDLDTKTTRLFSYENVLDSSKKMVVYLNDSIVYRNIAMYDLNRAKLADPEDAFQTAIPLKGEVVELREDGFLLKPDEESLAAANEAVKAQIEQYEAAKAAIEDEIGEEYPDRAMPDGFDANEDGLFRVQYLPSLDESLPENNEPCEVVYVSEDQFPAGDAASGPVTAPEDLPNVGDVVEVQAFNMGTFTEEQRASGFVNDDGGDLLFSTKLAVVESDFGSAVGEVTMLTADALTLWQEDAAQPTADVTADTADAQSGATPDAGKEVAFLLTPDTKLDEGVAEGSYVRVAWKAAEDPQQITADPPADGVAEAQTLVSVTLEEKPVVIQTAQGEMTMLGAATLTVMTDEGEKTFSLEEAQVDGELAEGAAVSVLYWEKDGQLIASAVTVEEAPVGPVEVLTMDGTATEVSEDMLAIDGSDGGVYAFVLSDATVEGDLEEDSPVTVVYYAQGDTLTAIHVLAEKPPVGPVVILTAEGEVTAVGDIGIELTLDDGTVFAFDTDTAYVSGQVTEGCRALVSYYQMDDQPVAVSVTVTEEATLPDAQDNAADALAEDAAQ